MRVEMGDHVFSQDGHDLGTIKHLIVDPATGHVKTVVVEKGGLLHDDTEIALDALQSADDQGDAGPLYVTFAAEQVKTLPRFDMAQYGSAPTAQEADGITYPLGSLLWTGGAVAQSFTGTAGPMGAGVLPFAAPFAATESVIGQNEGEQGDEPPDVAREYRRQQDRANAIVSEGDQIVSKDGETVGEVHSVVLDAATGSLTSLVARQGMLFTHDTTLLADSIASISDGVITLNLNKSQLAL